MKKKMLLFLLVACLTFSFTAVYASATGTSEAAGTTATSTYDMAAGTNAYGTTGTNYRTTATTDGTRSNWGWLGLLGLFGLTGLRGRNRERT